MSGRSYFRRRNSGKGAAFSLFPFLAVLLCTMGVLILLLVVISRNIRDKAMASGIPPTTPRSDVSSVRSDEMRPNTAASLPVDPKAFGLEENATPEEVLQRIRTETDTVTWLTGEILSSRERTKEQLDDARARIAEIEDAVKKLVEELEHIHELMQSLGVENKNPTEELAALRERLEEKREQLDAAERELEHAKQAHALQNRSYAIVPYRGPNGTFRRPIYIECRNDSVVIQPEGIVLRSTDFQTPDFRENPIEVCVRTVRHYFVGAGHVQRGTEPYPLFLVRPSGIYAYEAARRSLGSWRNDFGYELVDADWNLEFPGPSEELKQRLRDQLDIARTRQAAYLQAESLHRSAAEKVRYRIGARGSLEPVTGFSGSLHPAENAVFSGSNVGNSGGGGGEINVGSGGEGEGGTDQGDGGTENHGGSAGDSGDSAFGENGKSGESTDSRNTSAVSPPGATGESSHTSLQARGPAGLPSVTFEQIVRGPKTEARRQNWALKNEPHATAAVNRVVKVICENDRFILPKQPGLFRARDIPISRDSSATAEHLVRELGTYMESWDSAGENRFWRPVLKIQVRDGAEARFEQLRIDLQNSGLGIERAR